MLEWHKLQHALLRPAPVPAFYWRKADLDSLSLRARHFFEPRDRSEVLGHILPGFDASDPRGKSSENVNNLLRMLVPTTPAQAGEAGSRLSDFLPTCFGLLARQGQCMEGDLAFVDFFATVAERHLTCPNTPFGSCGIFDEPQACEIFALISRLTGAAHVEGGLGWGETSPEAASQKANEIAGKIAPLITYSLSGCGPEEEEEEEGLSIISGLEGLIAALGAFLHDAVKRPAYVGPFVGLLVGELANEFCCRCTMEQSGQLGTPPQRKIDDRLRRRFVRLLRGPALLACFSREPETRPGGFEAVKTLACLEPGLVLPAVLRRVYGAAPAADAAVEPEPGSHAVDGHAKECGLMVMVGLANIMSKLKGFRCHLPALLRLARTSLDRNDVATSGVCLRLVRSIVCCLPWALMAGPGGGEEEDDDDGGGGDWVKQQAETIKEAAAAAGDADDIEIDYGAKLSDEGEAWLLGRAAGGVGRTISGLFDDMFKWMEDVGNQNRIGPEGEVVPPVDELVDLFDAAFTLTGTGCLMALSPALLGPAIDRLGKRLKGVPVLVAETAMISLCVAACRADPERALDCFVPILVRCVGHEIEAIVAAAPAGLDGGEEKKKKDEHYAGLEKHLLDEYPVLKWYSSILIECLQSGGTGLVRHKDTIQGLVSFVRRTCTDRRVATLVGPLVGGLLHGLTNTYTVGASWCLGGTAVTQEMLGRGTEWDKGLDIVVGWYRPSPDEVRCACDLFQREIAALEAGIRSSLPATKGLMAKRKRARDLADACTNVTQLLRGVATLFDPFPAGGGGGGEVGAAHDDDDDDGGRERVRARSGAFRPLLARRDPLYGCMQELWDKIWTLASDVRAALEDDDVGCLESLYELYRALVADVGLRHSFSNLDYLRQLRSHWVKDVRVLGSPEERYYPRPLHALGIEVRYRERQAFCTGYRRMGEPETRLLRGGLLADDCTSPYESVRSAAAVVLELALKSLAGSARLAIPPLVDRVRALAGAGARTQPRVVSGLRTLLKLDVRLDWTRRCGAQMAGLMDLCIQTCDMDQNGARELTAALAGRLAATNKRIEHSALLGSDTADAIAPPPGRVEHALAAQRAAAEAARAAAKTAVAAVAVATLAVATDKPASFVPLAGSALLDFTRELAPEYIRFVVEHANADRLDLRMACRTALEDLGSLCRARCDFAGDHGAFSRAPAGDAHRTIIDLSAGGRERDRWTGEYLARFELEKRDGWRDSDFFVDNSSQGSLVWGTKVAAAPAQVPSFSTTTTAAPAGSPPEARALALLGSLLTRDWLSAYFDSMREEYEESEEAEDMVSPRLRMDDVWPLLQVFTLVGRGATAARVGDVQELVEKLAEPLIGGGDDADESDLRHLATAGILLALLRSCAATPRAFGDVVVAFAMPIVLHVLDDGLTAANKELWRTCFDELMACCDSRRFPDLAVAAASLGLDKLSQKAVATSYRLEIVHVYLRRLGWRLRRTGPIVAQIMAHVDSPHVEVCRRLGKLLADLFFDGSHCPSYADVPTLMAADRGASSIGIRPYQASPELRSAVSQFLQELALRREECAAARQASDAYVNACEMAFSWLTRARFSAAFGQLVDLPPAAVLDELFRILDVRHPDQEALMKKAVIGLCDLAELTFPASELAPFLAALVEKTRPCRQPADWEGANRDRAKRKAALSAIETLCFRRLLLLPADERRQHRLLLRLQPVIDCVGDADVDIRDKAVSVLSNILRRLPIARAQPTVDALVEDSLKALAAKGAKKATRGKPAAETARNEAKKAAVEMTRRRLAAISTLRSLIDAFPQLLPLPPWMRKAVVALAPLAQDTSDDVGKAAAAAIASFWMPRRDDWEMIKQVSLATSLFFFCFFLRILTLH